MEQFVLIKIISRNTVPGCISVEVVECFVHEHEAEKKKNQLITMMDEDDYCNRAGERFVQFQIIPATSPW